jgi:tetratricopeptide (TPR) repeat protein
MKRDGFSRDRPGGAQETDDFPSNGYELYLRAQKLEEGRHYAQARALYEKFTGLNPNHPAGYARTASCLEKEGLEKRAINTWIQGTRVKTAPESEMIYFELGYAFLRAKKTEEAQRWWKEGLSKFPASPKLYQALARMYNDQGRIKEALVYAEQHPELRENPAVGALARAAQRAGEKKTGLRQFMSFPEGPPGEGSIELRISKGLREDVLRIYEVGRRTGVPLVFASYPDHAYPEVIAAAQESSGRFVDFRSIFKEKFKSREDYISDDDCHCNTAGYRVMAERLADEVERLLRP